ncbi:MAG TPA: hypothetical protein VLI71_18160 [Gammaproteobacteria bacterium]|nr:hypothetical protein [Gammaproteobacteria bacterium]
MWNRKPRAGYRVIHVPFSAGRPQGAARVVLTGFVGNTIWRVTAR